MATAKFVAALRCTAAAPLARSFSVTARATRGSRSSSLFSQRLAASAMVSQSKRRMLHSMTIVRADNAEEESPLPLPDDGAASAPLSPKVEKIVDDISGLTLLEVSSLVDALKDRLNIPDSAPMMMGSMPMMAGGVPGAAGAAGGDAAAEEPAEEKTDFDIKLEGFDAKGKIKIIKEVRALTGLGLKEAKEKVEGAPTVIKASVAKAEAEEIRDKLQELGATIALE